MWQAPLLFQIVGLYLQLCCLCLFLAPLNVKIEAISSKSIRISCEPPENSSGIDLYTAAINDNKALACNLKGNLSKLSCIIDYLSPSTKYTIKVTSWLTGEYDKIGSSVFEITWTRPPSMLSFNKLFHLKCHRCRLLLIGRIQVLRGPSFLWMIKPIWYTITKLSMKLIPLQIVT